MSGFWDFRLGPHELAAGGAAGLVLFPAGMRQAAIAGLESRKDKSDWSSVDVGVAYGRICALQWEIAMSEASNEISLRLDRLYRLYDASVNGTPYVAVPDASVFGGYRVTPAIPAGVAVFPAQSERDVVLRQRVEATNVLLQDILTAIQDLEGATPEDVADIISKLTTIISLL